MYIGTDLGGDCQGGNIRLDGVMVFDSGGFEYETPGTRPSNPVLGTWNLRADDGVNEQVFGLDSEGGPGAYRGRLPGRRFPSEVHPRNDLPGCGLEVLSKRLRTYLPVLVH